MSDLISRQAAIDSLHMHLMYRMGTDSNKKRLDDWINGLPSVQPKERTKERTETHACDLIDRQAAIDILDAYQVMVENGEENPYAWARLRMSELPSVQPDLSEYSDKLWHNAYERGKTEAEIQKMQDLEQAEIQKAYELGKLDAMEEIVRCKDCKCGVQDEIGRWYCRGLGCQIGDDDGSGFCSDAERREKCFINVQDAEES